MFSGRRNTNDGPLTKYEQQRLAQIASNKEKLESLNLPKMTEVQPAQTKKRKKRTDNHTRVAASEAHNLRPRPLKNYDQIVEDDQIENANDQIVEDADCESIGDFLSDNEDGNTSPQKKRRGRGITKMEDIFARTPDMPKIKILLNEYGQPVGSEGSKLSSVVGCMARQIPVSCSDWRLVDINRKDALWLDIKKTYDIDDAAKNWVLSTAGRKWKGFKATLKAEYFDPKLTDEELKKKHRERVNDEDWNYLVEYWMSPDAEVRAIVAKENRAKLGIHHTSGTKSFACSRHELGKQLGRPPRRDELYIKTHTRKNGVPIRNAEPIINKLKEIVEARPELKERTIQQGDALAVACGAKEPRGCVRGLGLGPTPQDVGIPGLKSYPSTRFQMEVFARKKAEERILVLQEQMKRQEERHAEEMRNMQVISHNGSTSLHHVSPSPRSVEYDDRDHDAHFQEEAFQEYGDHDSCGEYVLVHRRDLTPSVLPHQHSRTSSAPIVQTHATSSHRYSPNNATHEVQIQATSSRHCSPKNLSPALQPHGTSSQKCSSASEPHPLVTTNAAHEVQPHAAQQPKPMNNEAHRYPHDELIGRDVILYELATECGPPVAKGTIISTNPKAILAGTALGRQCCEVAVTHVLKKDAAIRHTYPGVEKMGDALKLSIAWPYKRLKVSKANSQQHISGGAKSKQSTH